MVLLDAIIKDCNESLRDEKCDSCLSKLLFLILELKKYDKEKIEKCANMILEINKENENYCECIWYVENIRKAKENN
jgi:hypothetical protein